MNKERSLGLSIHGRNRFRKKKAGKRPQNWIFDIGRNRREGKGISHEEMQKRIKKKYPFLK